MKARLLCFLLGHRPQVVSRHGGPVVGSWCGRCDRTYTASGWKDTR